MVQGRAVCAGLRAGHFTPTEVVNAHIYPEVLLLVLLLLHLLCKTVMAVVVPLSIILTSQEGNRLRERSKLSKFLGLCTGVNFTKDVGPPDTLAVPGGLGVSPGRGAVQTSKELGRKTNLRQNSLFQLSLPSAEP